MTIRLEHDPNGQHRSSFSNHEDIGPLVRAVLMGDVSAIVVIEKGVEKRFIPERDNGPLAEGKP